MKQYTVRNIPGIEQGKRTLIGTFDPFDPDKKASRSVVALVRWDRLDAWPLKDQSKMKTDLPIRVRFEWVEVPADQWHQVSNQNEVSELAGKSWETVQKWITEGKATWIFLIRVQLPRDGFRKIYARELRAKRGGEEFDLTPREVAILELLYRKKGEAVSRDELLDKCWGVEYFPESRTLDQHISKLRKRIEVDPENPTIIETIRGLGYRIRL